MSLIIKNKQSPDDIAIIIIKGKKGKKEISKNGDFTIIKINQDIVGINVANASKYFGNFSGVSTLKEEQIKLLNKYVGEIKKETFFKIGKIKNCQSHPQSNKLYVLEVECDRKMQIVTNYPHIKIDSKVVVALDGAVLPSGVLIEKTNVLGVKSEGMLCSYEALNLTSDSSGLIKPQGNNGDEFIL